MLAPAMRREKSVRPNSSPSNITLRRPTARTIWPSVASREQQTSYLPQAVIETVEKVNHELRQSRFPIGEIRCECSTDALYLTGVTSQYYYVQIALEAALRHAGKLPVQLHVVVAQRA
jgi:hypothetical protein